MGDFLICGFPRSRTLWLSYYLSVSCRSICAHEATEFAGSAEEFWSNAEDMKPENHWHYGNSDSANIFVLPALLAERPMTKVVWVNRDLTQVCKSMKAIGQPMDEKSACLLLALRDLYADYFDVVVDFEHLTLEPIAEKLWNFLLPDVPFNPLRFRQYNAQRICYTKEHPSPVKKTDRFAAWVSKELNQPVEK